MSRVPPSDYLAFLSAGASLYPLDALRLAGVDMTARRAGRGGVRGARVARRPHRSARIAEWPWIAVATPRRRPDGGRASLRRGSVYERLRRHPDVPFDAQRRHRRARARRALRRRPRRRPPRATWRSGVDRGTADAPAVRTPGVRPGARIEASGVAWRRSQPRQRRARPGRWPPRAGGWRARCWSEACSAPPATRTRPVSRSAQRRRSALPRHAGRGARAHAGVDLLVCATLPALSEAIGLAARDGCDGLPYLVGFVVRPTGQLLDGTPSPSR